MKFSPSNFFKTLRKPLSLSGFRTVVDMDQGLRTIYTFPHNCWLQSYYIIHSPEPQNNSANNLINEQNNVALNGAIQKLLTEQRKSQQKFLKASIADIVESIIQKYWEPVIDTFAIPRFKGDKVIDNIVGDLYSVDFQQLAIDCVVKVSNENYPLLRYLFDAQEKLGENATRDSKYNYRMEFKKRLTNFKFAVSDAKLFNYYIEMNDDSLSKALQVYFSTNNAKQEEKAKEIVCNKLTQIVERAVEPAFDELSQLYSNDELINSIYDKIASINYMTVVETSFHIATDKLKLEHIR